MNTRVRVWLLPCGEYSGDFNLSRFRKAQKGPFSEEKEKRPRLGDERSRGRCKRGGGIATMLTVVCGVWREDGRWGGMDGRSIVACKGEG